MFAPKGLQKMGVDKILGYVLKDPDKNLPKLAEWIDKFAGDSFDSQKRQVMDAITNKNNIYNGLLLRLLKSTDKDVMKSLLLNFFMNEHVQGAERRKVLRTKYDCNSPLVIMLELIERAGTDSNEELADLSKLPFNMADRIVNQGKELGTYVYILSGYEPLIRKNDIFRLCAKHRDCVFLCFTDGAYIDLNFADEMLRVKNFVPFISFDGNKEQMDNFHGEGSFEKAINAMVLLRKKRLLFGISCCYTKKSFEHTISEEHYERMMETGASFVNFHYLELNRDWISDELLDLEESENIREQLRKFRAEKPLFALNFQNSSKDLKACLGGGRKYLHISAQGEITPCEYRRESGLKIQNCDLREALCSEEFGIYKEDKSLKDYGQCLCPLNRLKP